MTGPSEKDKKRLSRVDIIVGVAAVGIGVILVALFLLTRSPGARVIVSVDGKEVASYDLSEDTDVIVQDLTEDAGKPDADRKDAGRNRLIIRNGEAWMEEADCPDKLCVHQGKISHVNDSIVCLPHRISIRIAGETKEPAPDAIAK